MFLCSASLLAIGLAYTRPPSGASCEDTAGAAGAGVGGAGVGVGGAGVGAAAAGGGALEAAVEPSSL